MARQHGPLQLTGSLGNLSFYYHKDYGYLVRQKGGARSGKVSARTQENGDELGAASRTGKLIRQGIRAGLQLQGDGTVSQRLTGRLYQVLRLDGTSARGERNVAEGLKTGAGKELLRSFAFVQDRPLERVLKTVPEYTDAGVTVLKGFVPGRDLSYPSGATHVEIRCAAIAVDAARNSYRACAAEGVVVALDDAERDVVLHCAHTGGGDFEVVVLGIAFLTEVNGAIGGIGGGCFGVVS